MSSEQTDYYGVRIPTDCGDCSELWRAAARTCLAVAVEIERKALKKKSRLNPVWFWRATVNWLDRVWLWATVMWHSVELFNDMQAIAKAKAAAEAGDPF